MRGEVGYARNPPAGAFKRAAAADLRRSAVASGMRTLLGDGKLKILRGMTTPGEIARVAQAEGISGEEEE